MSSYDSTEDSKKHADISNKQYQYYHKELRSISVELSGHLENQEPIDIATLGQKKKNKESHI